MITYLDYYDNNIAPVLERIDLFLKTEECNFIDIEIVSELLNISVEEITEIMCELDLDIITKFSFLMIMLKGSSCICNLFSRELKTKSPSIYSASDISYIYQIPYEHVKEAIDQSNIEYITSDNIRELFSNIYVKNEEFVSQS